MARFDPLAALSRQQRLATAARAAVDGCFPALTPVDVDLPESLLRKTNPITSPAIPRERRRFTEMACDGRWVTRNPCVTRRNVTPARLTPVYRS